jgi:hypothetical protein
MDRKQITKRQKDLSKPTEYVTFWSSIHIQDLGVCWVHWAFQVQPGTHLVGRVLMDKNIQSIDQFFLTCCTAPSLPARAVLNMN